MAVVSATVHQLADGPELTIRSPVPDDAPALLSVTRSVMAESGFTLTSPEEFMFTDDEEREWISAHADDPSSLLLAADVGGVIGLLNFAPDRRQRLAHWGTVGLSVQAKWRDLGIGRALVSTLIDWAERHPVIMAVRLQVISTNARAIHLYQSLGFVVEGRRTGAVQLEPGMFVDDLFMARLTPGGVGP